MDRSPPPATPHPPPAPNTPLAGDLKLVFNGETTTEGRLDIRAMADVLVGRVNGSTSATADVVKDALEELSVIGRGSIWVSASGALNSSTEEVTLTFEVYFHASELVVAPLNLGAMPLISVDPSGVAGFRTSRVEVVQSGTAPTNFSFPEQLVELICAGGSRASSQEKNTNTNQCRHLLATAQT